MISMVDKVIYLKEGLYIETQKLTSISEDVYESHFPYYPILPAVLILENAKQSIEILEKTEGSSCRIKKCKKVKFFIPIRPADVFRTTIEKRESPRNCYDAKILNQKNELVCKIKKIECVFLNDKGGNIND